MMADLLKRKPKQELSDNELYNLKVQQKKKRAKIANIVVVIFRAVLVIGICYYILYPLIAKLFSSFMQQQDLYDTTVGLIPKHWTLENYVLALKTMDFGKSFLNTFLITILVTVLQMASCTLVGYGFARYKFPLKGLLFALVIFTLIIPPTTIIIPMYLNFRFYDILGIFGLFTGGVGINLMDSVWAIVIMSITCMGFKNGLYIYMIRQFYRGVPKELEEAALIDGAGHFRTFISVMLPSAKPILTVVAMFSIVWQWTDIFYSQWFLPSMSLLSTKLMTISADVALDTIGLTAVLDSGYANIMISTGTILVIVPILIFYIIGQKQFVEGIERSGIVG